MTPAQVAFSVALGVVTLVITLFTLYVVSSTMWADRWYRRGPSENGAADPGGPTENG